MSNDTRKILVECEGESVILDMAADWQNAVRNWIADRVDANHFRVGSKVTIHEGFGRAGYDCIVGIPGRARSLTIPASYAR